MSFPVNDPELGNDCEGFQPKREAPEILEVIIRSTPGGDVEEDGEDEHWRINEEVVVEVIDLGIVSETVGPPELNEINDEGSGGDEEDFEDHVVVGNEVEEQVHVSGGENDEVDFLSAIGEFLLEYLAPTWFS